MIKLEKTTLENRYNLVDTEKRSNDDDYYLKQISEEEAIYLLRSILAIFIPYKPEELEKK